MTLNAFLELHLGIPYFILIRKIMFPCKIGSVLFLLISGFNYSFSQRSITVEEVIQLTLERSDQLKAADATIDHDRLLEKTGGFIPDPELILESPTGNFMTLGVQQSFAFPTVYAKQKQLGQQQTILSEKARMITESELRKRIKEAYLQWQFAYNELEYLKEQDSLLYTIAETAEREFTAGQIDFVMKSYAQIKYVNIHTQFLEAEGQVAGDLLLIQQYAGITEDVEPTKMIKLVNNFAYSNSTVDSSMLINTPIMAYHRQRELISEKAIQLEKNKVLPNMTIGYLNQADKNTPFSQRLRFGMSVPLWFWQHSTSINAAKTMLNVSKRNTSAQAFELSQAWITAKNDALKYEVAMSYYESAGLSQADEMVEAGKRMYAAGQFDYIKYLTTLSDAFQMKLKYITLVRNYNEALISLQYLIGQ